MRHNMEKEKPKKQFAVYRLQFIGYRNGHVTVFEAERPGFFYE